MPERRKFRRRKLIYYLKIIDRTTGKVLGHLVDITHEGLMLISEKPLPINQRYNLRLVFPTEIEGKSYIDFEATSRWSELDINPDYYASGLEFDSIISEDTSYIIKLIEEYAFQD